MYISKLSWNSLFIATAIMILGFTSCSKHDEYPIEPVIEYKSFDKIATPTGVDNKGYLTINFTDGDGDIGLEENDTLPPYHADGDYYYNFLIEYFELQEDSFVNVELPFTFNARIPNVEEELSYRGIKGEITIEVYFNNIGSTSDSIKFSAQIIDRALNKSNIIMTPAIYVQKAP